MAAGSRGLEFFALAYDAAAGARTWEASAPEGAYTFSHALSPDGRTLVVHGDKSLDGTGPGTDSVTVAYDARSGARTWVARWDGGAGVDLGTAIDVSPDGARVFVTGKSLGGGLDNMDYATRGYDAATGDLLWTARYSALPLGGYEVLYDVAASPDGDLVYVTGSSLGATLQGPGDFATVAYDARTGAQRWLSTYGTPGHNIEYGSSLGVSPDGRAVYVAGWSWVYVDSTKVTGDVATLALDATTGARRWAGRYETHPAVSPVVIAIHPRLTVGASGRVHVAAYGWSAAEPRTLDYVTLTYGA